MHFFCLLNIRLLNAMQIYTYTKICAHRTRTQLQQLTDVKRIFRSMFALSEMRVSCWLKDWALYC